MAKSRRAATILLLAVWALACSTLPEYAAPKGPLIDPALLDTSDVIPYRAVAHHLRFHAQMDRACSWWNPEELGVPQEYILEHEQTHFALFELEARRLNASVPEIGAQLDAAAPTPEGAAENANESSRT